jgi:hypothetical protein
MAQAPAGGTSAASLGPAADVDAQHAVQWMPEQQHFMQLAIQQVKQATVCVICALQPH